MFVSNENERDILFITIYYRSVNSFFTRPEFFWRDRTRLNGTEIFFDPSSSFEQDSMGIAPKINLAHA
jgi:hypothetical protein